MAAQRTNATWREWEDPEFSPLDAAAEWDRIGPSDLSELADRAPIVSLPQAIP